MPFSVNFGFSLIMRTCYLKLWCPIKFFWKWKQKSTSEMAAIYSKTKCKTRFSIQLEEWNYWWIIGSDFKSGLVQSWFDFQSQRIKIEKLNNFRLPVKLRFLCPWIRGKISDISKANQCHTQSRIASCHQCCVTCIRNFTNTETTFNILDWR